MNKFLRFLLPTIAIIFLFNAAAGTVSAQDKLRQILKRMDENNKALTSLKGSIKMNKFNAQLGENDLTEGSINYLPGKTEKQMYVRIDWTKPLVEHLAIANGEYALFRPHAKQLLTGKVDSVKGNGKAGGALAFMTMSKAQLSQNYSVRFIAEETITGGVETFHIELTPKAATSYKSADLWVDVNGMPVQARIVEKNNDTTTVLLSGVQKNATIKANVFKISPPRDVKVIRS